VKLLRVALVAVMLAAAAPAAWAQSKFPRGVAIRPLTIYVSPATNAARLGQVPRGREINLLEQTPGGWLHVFVMNDQNKDVSGWIEDKGIVRADTPDGDRILFGEAVDSEAEAQKRHGRKGAERDAARLYMRVTEYFPISPLAGEAHYRAADIMWQVESIDVWSRASAREQSASMRSRIDDEQMRKVKKKYPGTKWADLADYAMLDNKICGDWQGESKCPEKEAELYTKYADEHPKSPKAAEALYNAAWRQSALIEIYKTENESGKSAAAKARAIALAQRITSAYPESDYGTRATRLIFLVEQGLPTYGSPSD
jgi:outer membrane protein assembly factor BamD (BamD/ComL family)